MEMERRGTFGEEDQVGLFLISPGGSRRDATTKSEQPFQVEDEACLGGAYACLSSNKHGRLLPGGSNNAIACINEDKIQLERLCLKHQGRDEAVLFAAVFDGHGGTGKAAGYVADHLKASFLTHFSNIEGASLPERIALALEQSFTATDTEFFRHVMAEAARADVRLRSQDATRCCRFFNEDPCVCRKPPIPANEGSTATVVVITSSHLVCANVGDSDAFLVQSVQVGTDHDEEDDLTTTSAAGASPLSNASSNSSATSAGSSLEADSDLPHHHSSSKRQRRIHLEEEVELVQLSVSHTPLVDEKNEDYCRIRSIAQRRNVTKMDPIPGAPRPPADGILRSVRGARFNYVSVPGARSLNMVRAFGNLGNKKFVEGNLVEDDSPIIPRPDVKIVARDASIRAVVMGSDGLWDNVDKANVASVVRHRLLLEEEDSKDSSRATKQCARELLQRALKARRKPDDISVLVVPLDGSRTGDLI